MTFLMRKKQRYCALRSKVQRCTYDMENMTMRCVSVYNFISALIPEHTKEKKDHFTLGPQINFRFPCADRQSLLMDEYPVEGVLSKV